MFRLLNSHLQANSLQSQDAVHTLGSQCVYISGILKPCHLPRRVERAKCVTNWLKYIKNSYKKSVLAFTIYQKKTLTRKLILPIETYLSKQTESLT